MSHLSRTSGQVNLFAALLVVALAVAGIWVWHHLSFDTQDFIVDEIIPLGFVLLIVSVAIWLISHKFRRHRKMLTKRDEMIQRFHNERSSQKQRDLAFELIEINRYKLAGLETIANPMAELFLSTLRTAIGDKQHRIRGMAASYLGVLHHRAAVPSLIQALEDDHAHVRASAALALGRLQASEAKDTLEKTMVEDWDQTVRSRAREAVERIR